MKRPGQTLGLYIREGNGLDRCDGVFISRIAIDSAVYSSGCLQLGDEILAVNLVDVTRMSLDDVVIIMSIPRRLVLTTRYAVNPKHRMPMSDSFGRRRSRSSSGNRSYMAAAANGNGGMVTGYNNNDAGGKATPPVVVYKGNNRGGNDMLAGYRGDYDRSESPRGGHFMPYRDARTLTWDRNPKPDRNDPKYFPVNSLPRQQQQNSPNMMQQSQSTAVDGGGGGGYGRLGGGDLDSMSSSMPPPMRELSTGYPPMMNTPSRADDVSRHVSVTLVFVLSLK